MVVKLKKTVGSNTTKERAKTSNIKDNILPSTKTLRIVWIAEVDTFTFLSNNVDDDFNCRKKFFREDINII